MADTDHELLEMAAKAAGELYTEPFEDGILLANGEDWNPLADDGDALQLAVKLELCVSCPGVAQDANGHLTIDKSDDPYAATRRAIVRAAAKIGRAM